jgi:hypothetical protein
MDEERTRWGQVSSIDPSHDFWNDGPTIKTNKPVASPLHGVSLFGLNFINEMWLTIYESIIIFSSSPQTQEPPH